MSDIFNEQLVKKETTLKDMIYKVLILTIAVVLAAASALIGMMPVVLLLEIFIIVFLFRKMNVEYEYVLTNTELDINKIFNKSSRKHLVTIPVKNITVMVPANKPEYLREVSDFQKKVDYSSRKITEDTYIAIYKASDQMVQMTFEPNERLLKSLKMFIPSVIKK